ncbi:hypothetical protein [Streptomyces sp. NPDC008001]|uniref:hypothetical protein n=1 Tax=Streptomyces sp. NPDC008001 TaxID=3364804 RepID=UPI0036E01B3F
MATACRTLIRPRRPRPRPRPGGPAASTGPKPGRPGSVDRAEARAAATDAIVPLLTEPDTVRAADEVHRRLHELGAGVSHVRHALAELPLKDEAAARALGRCLVRTGTSAPAVSVGLGLLARLGEPEDVPCLKVLGLFRTFTRPVITALTSIDCPAAALVWLSRYIEGRELRRLVDALLAHDDRAARAGLLAVSLDRRAVGSATARRIAEAVMLDDVISDDPVDARPLAQAGRLLSRMAGAGTYQCEILAYDRAVAAYEAFVTRACRLRPGVDHYAILLSVALDLHSGPGVLLDWRPGRREALLDILESLLTSPAWAAAVPAGDPADPTEPTKCADRTDRRRVHWIRRAARQPFTRPAALRATAEPREVQLTEAYCTEGCCGAPYVTIRRDGDHVVWSDWRHPDTLPSEQPAPVLPEYRFDAPAYDAEIARPENDHSWAWPARNAARLITAGLRDRPGILARWDARMD